MGAASSVCDGLSGTGAVWVLFECVWPVPAETAGTSVEGGAGGRLGMPHFRGKLNCVRTRQSCSRKGAGWGGKEPKLFLSFFNAVSVTLIAKPVFNTAKVRNVKSSIFQEKNKWFMMTHAVSAPASKFGCIVIVCKCYVCFSIVKVIHSVYSEQVLFSGCSFSC